MDAALRKWVRERASNRCEYCLIHQDQDPLFSETMFDRITFDPHVMGGRACIRGMRIPVSVVVSQVAHGADFNEILADYPDLEREDIQQALQYAAWLTQEQVHAG